MVRSKEVLKKPKDPLLTPSSKPRGFRDDDHDGSRPRNRGGAAMSPTPASVPNYMRATSSSGAKAGHCARLPPSSASPPRRRPVRVVTRGKVLFPKVTGLGRATCSSTIKEAKFPDALDLALGATDAEGPAALRVCPYTYCSLNGHVHAPAVPLRSFLALRRRLIKTQQSMKLKGFSAFRKSSSHQRPEDKNGAGAGAKVAPLIDEGALGDYFVEVYAGPRLSSDMSCSDMSLDEMDAAVRRMEFVVFDRCGADEDNDKGNDLGVCGDGEGEGRLEERLGVCRDSSSECSDAAISGDFVEELPWMRYQAYEYDSLDDDVSEEQGVRDEGVSGAEVSEVQEGENEEGTSGRLGDECEEEAVEKQEANHEENISDVAHEADIVAKQAGTLCGVEVCEEQEETDEDNILDKACRGEASAGQGTPEEKLSGGVCKLEILDQEVAETVENILDEGHKEETSADQEAEDDDTSWESAGKLEVTEVSNTKDEENMPDDGSEMDISEIVSGVGCKEDFFEEVTSKAASGGEISDFSAIGSTDVEIQKQPIDGHAFEQDDSTVDDAFDQDDSTADNAFEQDDKSADSHDDAQRALVIRMSKFEVASEETGTAQGTDQDDTVDGTKDAHEDLAITTCNLEHASEDSAIAQENSQDGNSGCFNEGAQMVPEITTCKLEDASEESGTKDAHEELEITTCNLEDASEDSAISQENSQDGNSGCAQMVPEITTCKLEDASEESDTAQETIYDDNSACLFDCAQMELGIGRSELEYATEKAGIIAQEAGQDDKSSYVSDDAQNASGITMCKLEVASEEFVITQEADQDDNSADVSDGAQNESQYTTCESVDTSEKFDVTQEAIQDENTVDVNGAAQKELEIITSEDAHEESDITQGDEDDYTAGVNAGAQKELNITACESGGTSEELAMIQEADGHVNTTDLSDSDQKEFANACKEFCTTEETNLSSNVQIPEHTYDFSTIEEHGEPQNLPAEDTDAKESSIDDICDIFSGMNLKGDVYLDPTETATCPRNRLIIARRRNPEQEEYMRGFNPRAPNFLPLELDPEAEKVDLKHQMMDERKNAEEWMIDYALRRAVNNLGPARKKKVELLVQAFETVLPHDEDDKKSITPTRPVQACN